MEPDPDLPTGTQVGEYVIDHVLGRGGFGTVYRGVHPVIGKQVAIKVLSRTLSGDEAMVSRFAAEARAVNQIKHRNIIDIFQFSTLADGRHYYVMECLEGETLDAYLKTHGRLSLAEALPILRAIGRALDAAHAKGIAHRDLKPENIFLATDSDGERVPKLLDFGIAKLFGDETGDVRHRTATGMPIGTPYYMSPEQCRGKDVDQRTDIYSFGILAYRLLTGTYPFEGADYLEILSKQVHEEAPPPSRANPSLPATVDAAVAWMMRKDPADRPRTLQEAIAAIDDVTSRVAGDAFARTLPTTTPIAKSPRRAAVWIGSGLVLVAGVMLYVKTQDRSGEAPASGPADRGGAPPEAPQLQPPSQAGNSGSVEHSLGGPGAPREAQATVELTLEHLPPHASITVDGVVMKPPIDVTPGAHVIVIEAPGKTTLTKRIQVDAPTTIDATMLRR